MFSLVFSLDGVVEFSRNYITNAIAVDWTQGQLPASCCLLLNWYEKKLPQLWTMLLTKNVPFGKCAPCRSCLYEHGRVYYCSFTSANTTDMQHQYIEGTCRHSLKGPSIISKSASWWERPQVWGPLYPVLCMRSSVGCQAPGPPKPSFTIPASQQEPC